MASMLTPQPILTAAETRAAEAASGVAVLDLAHRASRAAAVAIDAFGVSRDVLVLCGPGMNGGDGYGIAVQLIAMGHTVRVAAVAPSRGDAAAMAALWQGPVATLAAATPAATLVDAVFGTGLTRALDPVWSHDLARLAAGARTVIAIDLPSGIDSDSGADLGAFADADLTIAFATLKPAHVLEPARRRCGRVVVADIGLGATASRLYRTAPPRLRQPGPEAHKYSRGSVLVLGGPPGQGGAARLAADAALRSGAGLALLAVPAAALAENGARLDAVMLAAVDDAAGLAALFAARRFTAVAAGPGLGHDARPLVEALLASGLPAVLDADVFTLFAGDPSALRSALRGPAVLTPHEGEFARLFGTLPGSKIDRARAAAATLGAVLLLKGADTVIAHPDGRAAVNDHASPWLATAGSGDVLTGVIAGLIAQGEAPFEAACAAAWLHGDAGRRGGAGLTADDLPGLIAQAMRGLR